MSTERYKTSASFGTALPRSRGPRRPFLWITGLTIGLLLTGGTALVWGERIWALEQAQEAATRRANRLALDLAQSLTLAQRAIELSQATTVPPASTAADDDGPFRQHSALLSALALPIELHTLDITQAMPTTQGPLPVTERWLALAPQSAAAGDVLPLVWPLSGRPHAFQADLSLAALQARLERDRVAPGGGTAVFRLDPDGRVTVLARAPHDPSVMGLPLGGPIARVLTTQAKGSFASPGAIDGIRRRTSFQRLPAPADSLVVAYGFAEADILATWSSRWPWVALLAVVLSLVVGWVGWRLDRSQARLARSEQRLRLALASGQVWEWDVETGHVSLPDSLWRTLGHDWPSRGELVPAISAAVWPDDLQTLQECLRRHFRNEAPLEAEFRLCDVSGKPHWFAIEGCAHRNAAGRVTYVAGTAFETSERHRLEEEQRQLLQHLDTVANASAALAWTVDADQHPDWLNQAWLNFTGRDLAAECASFWLDDVHPEDRSRCEPIFNDAFASRQPYSMEYRLRRHDGQYRWLHEQGRPRYDADHQFVGYVGSSLDVTELREAQAAAQERGAVLKQVFDVLKDLLFVVDSEEHFIFFQAGAEDRLYRKPEEFIGRTIGEIMPAHLVDMFRVAMKQARHKGPQSMDYELDLPGGQRHFNARLAWLADGQRCMFLVRDVTEQHAVEADHERLNDLVLLLFRLASRFINLPLQQMDDAVNTALGDMGRAVRADRAYLFSYDQGAGTASNTHEWCAEGIAAQIADMQNVPVQSLQQWHQMHLQGQRVEVADVLALPESALKDFLKVQGLRGLLTLPLMDGTSCLGFVGLDLVHEARKFAQEEISLLELFAQMLVNMHLRAQSAAQVREMTEHLEHMVEERTQQLNNSVQRLQTVNRELESFNYSASHDLRTPLRGIEGFSALLLSEYQEQFDERGRDYLQRIQHAAQHMSRLVNDLLAYSRLQQMTERLESLNLGAVVQEVLFQFRDELAARRGHVDVDVPEDLTVRADPQGLAIVLRNLIDNALKFTPAAQAPLIRIEAGPQADRVGLSVSDRGMGFDMHYREHIFGMFQRLHRQDQIPGTGIGLALVKKAVDRMGGHITAVGTPGEGARFDIDLPRGT